MSKPLEFYLITDLHHYSQNLGTEGKAYTALYNREQKCLAETGAIIDAYIDKIISDKSIDKVLIAGDVSYDGALESHLDLIPRLERFHNAGKRVFLITATHDYFVEGNETGHAHKYIGDESEPATPTDREKLVELYHGFGPDEAISVHKPSHSYVVQLDKGYRLLCLNDDGDRVFCGYDRNELDWILNEIRKAHEAGDYIFGMTHHPTLPPFPLYPDFSPRDMLGDWENTTTLLADAGLELMFTGHTHMQNIALKTTQKGNRYYDVNTSALTGYPSCMRKVKIDDSKIEIRTETIDSFDWDLKGKTVEKYLEDHFTFFLNDIVDSAANDLDHFAELGKGFSMSKEKVQKLKIPLTVLGKGLQKLTLGGAGRLLGVSKSIEPCVKDVKVKDLVITVIRNIYRGNEDYCPGTAEYKAMSALIDSVGKKLSHFEKTKGILPTLEKIKQSMYNAYPDDYELVIDRNKK